MSLSDPTIRNARPQEKPYRLFDERGLYIEIRPTGAKYWRLKYRIGGKEKLLALGVYPEVSLKAARAARDEARAQVRAGEDPSLARKAKRQQVAADAALTFRAVASEWHKKKSPAWVPEHASTVLRALERDFFPALGAMPVGGIKPELLLSVLRRIEERGAPTTAKRSCRVVRNVFAYAGVNPNPAADLGGRLATPAGTHFDAVTEPAPLGRALQAIDADRTAGPAVHAALRLLPLLFVRPTELRTMRWSDVDMAIAEWRYTVTKTKQHHIVPLARQAIDILEGLRPLTGHGCFVFPSEKSPRGDQPIAKRTLQAALRRLGEATATTTLHGFRATARTILDEVLGFRADYIEHQLAHSVRDPLGRAYNRTSHLPERKAMMQAWADYLDSLKRGDTNVVPLKTSRAG